MDDFLFMRGCGNLIQPTHKIVSNAELFMPELGLESKAN